MKKFLALALALVMALALAVPAMAFTNAVEEEDVYSLEIALVEYEDKDFFGILSAAPADRGYAKNEVVAFIVTFTAEKGAKFEGDTAAVINVTGEKVSFNVTENNTVTERVVGGAAGQTALNLDVAQNKLTNYIKGMDASKKAQTVKFLGFAKVTGDEASITAEVSANGAIGAAEWADGENTIDFVVGDDTYTINNTTKTLFYVTKTSNGTTKSLFEITVDGKGKSKALVVYADEVPYTIVEGVNGYVFLNAAAKQFSAASTDADKLVYDKLVAVVEDEFEGVFGFDYSLLGGLVNRKYFDDMIGYKNLSVTADIAPWVAYVQVPDVIVVDPPKTGDATVLVGIVMAIVAAAGVVVFNKVRA